MLIDFGLLILSTALIYAVFRLVKYDSQTNFSVSEKITTFLHIFIPYLLMFLSLIIGFYLDLERSWGGFGVLAALVVCKLMPNLSLFLSATKDREEILIRYFQSHHTDIIYGYLLAVLKTSICRNCPTLVISIVAYFIGITLNCNFYYMSIRNLKQSFQKTLGSCLRHWKALVYATGILLVFWIVPILHNFIMTHICAIATPFILVLICGLIYIIKIKCDSRKNSSIS